MTRYFWTPVQDTVLQRMAADGATNAAIADATGRTIGSVRRRRQETVGKRQRRGKTKGPAPLVKRIAALEATIDAEMAERRPDWDRVDELLSGLEYLTWKAAQ